MHLIWRGLAVLLYSRENFFSIFFRFAQAKQQARANISVNRRGLLTPKQKKPLALRPAAFSHHSSNQ
jgi:hypothetical protein